MRDPQPNAGWVPEADEQAQHIAAQLVTWMPASRVRSALRWLAKISVGAAVVVGLAALYWLAVSL